MSRFEDFTDDDLFEIAEAEEISRGFVCAVCHGELAMFPVRGDRKVILACEEHGSVARSGRVTRSTVSIYHERSLARFKEVIRNLPDLWGELIPSREQSMKELGF